MKGLAVVGDGHAGRQVDRGRGGQGGRVLSSAFVPEPLA